MNKQTSYFSKGFQAAFGAVCAVFVVAFFALLLWGIARHYQHERELDEMRHYNPYAP